MTKEKFHHAPPPKALPLFITTDTYSSTVPYQILDEVNDLLVNIGQLHIENTAMKQYLVRTGKWKGFVKFFDQGYEPNSCNV